MEAKTKKYLIISGCILGAGLVGLIIYKRKQSSKIPDGLEDVLVINSTNGQLVPLSSICKPQDESFPLAKLNPPIGSSFCPSKKVVKLQKSLNNKMSSPMTRLDIDGYFGDKTEAALISVTGEKEVSSSLFTQLTMGIY